MIDKSHIEYGGDQVRVAATEKIAKLHEADASAAIKYYMDSPEYTEVYLVTCNKCGKPMCLEVFEPATAAYYRQTHHQGRRRITLGFADAPDGYLLSHRKRLDGAMGYKCVCGNNTILSKHELGLVPQTKDPKAAPYLSQMEPHQEAELRIRMSRENYKPDIEVNGLKTRIESFTIERLK